VMAKFGTVNRIDGNSHWLANFYLWISLINLFFKFINKKITVDSTPPTFVWPVFPDIRVRLSSVLEFVLLVYPTPLPLLPPQFPPRQMMGKNLGRQLLHVWPLRSNRMSFQRPDIFIQFSFFIHLKYLIVFAFFCRQ
jgi:hypothetical protein